MVGFDDKYDDITKHILFAEARDNFFKAACYGIDTTFSWLDDTKISAIDLVKTQLIPIARRGLDIQKVNSKDIDRYLGVIEARATKHMNGARWLLRGYTKLIGEVGKDEALSIITATTLQNQLKEIPIHQWPGPETGDLIEYKPQALTVGECMTTDLFTARKEDIIDLVGEMMDWRQIRYMPVEDDKGKLLGLVTSRLIIRELLREKKEAKTITVEEIMISNPIAVTPETTVREAMRLMRENRIGALPVVHEPDELIGIITEMDFLRITARLLDRLEQVQNKSS
jgi:CBS domain-containing protein